jgi:hypothetical protein
MLVRYDRRFRKGLRETKHQSRHRRCDKIIHCCIKPCSSSSAIMVNEFYSIWRLLSSRSCPSMPTSSLAPETSYYSPHFFASRPSGGTASTWRALTSFQSVLRLVPPLSVKLFIMARCCSGVAFLYSFLKKMLTSDSSSESPPSMLSQFLGPERDDVG